MQRKGSKLQSDVTPAKAMEIYSDIVAEIKQLNNILQEYISDRDLYSTLKSSIITGMPISHNVSDSVLNKVIELAENKDKTIHYLTNRIAKLTQLKETMDLALITDLPFEERTVLIEFYLKRKTIELIAPALPYSIPAVYKVKHRALQMLDKALRKRIGNNYLDILK